MSIPMPGHAVSGASEKAARESIARLEALIAEHDAVFLLMDSRESRWLPSMICSAQNKVLLAPSA
jgi:ubiquitin-like modifier-activating enzyme ATG7